SHRFINGVLRRISEVLDTVQAATGN
ncbi:N utilization substance protein B, partial [Escherichia coli]|nr:N utilization substance protein B [Escherichia coli]